QADRDALESFHVGQFGPLTPFLLNATNDNTQTNVALAGSVDGVNKAFQIPIPAQGQLVTWQVYAGGTAISSNGTGTPAAPTLGQVAGGAKAARTYYVRIEYVDAAGGTSTASAEASLAVSASSLLTVASPASAPGATQWQVFIGTAANGETLAATLSIGSSYTEPTGALPSGVAYATTDGTTFAVSNAGAVTFVQAPAAGVSLTWTGTYAYLVRFKDDNLEFNQMLSQFYEVQTITFRTVR
ncbi:MAG: DUF2460 domain-containing protein, partial [Rhodospirillales bacterium]|nr:DUF2460 domain-containing protein [Rhodospirillales bacterium]